MGDADVQRALRKIVRELEDAKIPYAIAGAMALNWYGYRRVTVDVDVLLSAQGLAELKSRVLGLGYVEKFPGSKGLRDTENNVGIDVLLAGDYPGDGPQEAPEGYASRANLRRESGKSTPWAIQVTSPKRAAAQAPSKRADGTGALEPSAVIAAPATSVATATHW